MKGLVYSNREIENVENLRQRIVTVTVRYNYSHRLEACLHAEDRHFEHVL